MAKCKRMNAARQISRRFGRTAGARANSALSDCVVRMSEDLRAEFPTNNGFSVRNLKYMRAFAAAWPNRKLIVQAPLAQLAWYSQIALIEKLKSEEDRLGYAQLAVENHWLRPQLVREIAARSIENLGKSANKLDGR